VKEDDVAVTLGAARSLRRLALVLGAAIAVAAAAPLTPAAAAPGDIGYEDQSYAGAGSAPTGEKPESKLWWNDGVWWASMWDTGSSDFHIFRLDAATQTWQDTGVPLDTRSGTKADTLWDGTHLYVASHKFSGTGASGADSLLYRFSYDANTDTYSLDPGFPAVINTWKTDTLVIAKDSTGKLWATWTAPDASCSCKRVYVNRTLGSDASWGTPFALPVTGADTLSSDDISAVVSFGGTKIGVMWSNQNVSAMYFAVHVDGDPDTTWQASRTAVQGPRTADDHINLKALQAADGRVFAAVKTSMKTGSAPLIMLLVRDPSSGDWSSAVFGRVADSHTRPIVMLDEEHRVIHMFATCPQPPNTSGQSGGDICEKTSPLDSIGFPTGIGTAVIRDADSADMNNATSTKQNVDSTTGLVVLASNDTTDRYWHAYESLGGGGGGGDTTAPNVISTSPTDGATGVAVAANVTATFSEDVTGVNGTTFTLTQGSTSVPATVTYQSSTRTATLDPAADLSPATTYTATLTSGIADGAGNPLAGAPVTWSFTTGSQPPPSGAISLAGAPVSASTASATSVTLPSWSPGPNDLILVAISQRDESKAVQVSGNGLTWTELANVDNTQGQGGVSLWWAQGAAPSPGSITVTIAGNTKPVVVVAQRFAGVATSGGVEALATNPGPGTDNANMLQSVTTLTPGAWAIGAGWHRGQTFAVPSGESPVLVNQTAGASGDTTRASMWYEGPVATPAPTQVGAAGDLSGAGDWAMVAVSLRPA
jgi:hypothetical protein